MADSQRFLDTSVVKGDWSPWEVYRKGKVHIYKRPTCQRNEFWGNQGHSFILGHDSSHTSTAKHWPCVSPCHAPGQVQDTASNPHRDPGGREVSTVPILQMRKLGLGGCEGLVQSLRAGGLNSVSRWDLSFTYEIRRKGCAFPSHFLEVF